MKKIIALIFAVVMVISLSACVNNGGIKQNSGGSNDIFEQDYEVSSNSPVIGKWENIFWTSGGVKGEQQIYTIRKNGSVTYFWCILRKSGSSTTASAEHTYIYDWKYSGNTLKIIRDSSNIYFTYDASSDTLTDSKGHVFRRIGY